MNDIHPRLIARRAVAQRRADPPCSEASIISAREAQRQEREAACQKLGIEISDDGTARIIPKLRPLNVLPIESEGIPLDVRVGCGEAIDAAVEAYGLPAVLRSVRLVAALNGQYIRVIDDAQAGA